ncbi:MAG: hypothetical protein LBF72_04115 [Holosporales bacterium]|nr:hypothetical protein [Holosporales bacterium]
MYARSRECMARVRSPNYTKPPKVCGFVDPLLGLSSTFSTALRLCYVSPAHNSFADLVYAMKVLLFLVRKGR